MLRNSSKFICQQCGYESVGYLGKCPNCGEWNTLVETVVSTKSITPLRQGSAGQAGNKTIRLSEIKINNKSRISTKISELDRVLGGGIVGGQVILIAGEPGIGKSTLLLELSNNLDNTLYICGEESASQVAIRAQRLGVKNKNINLLENTDVDEIISQLNSNNKQSAVIVDSIQTMTTSDLSGMAGAVGQVKECASRLVRFAKSTGIPVFIVGHVTKEGTVAGPSVLAHIVDTVLWFEGDRTTNLRVLRSIKNRFGPTDEVGIFEMVDKGLISVTDSAKIFIPDTKSNVSGSAVASVMQGTRPILVEIQALVVSTKLAFPKRVAQGIDQKRLEVIIAVLIRRCGLPLYNFDIFINVSGGIKVTEPGSDLAVALAIASSYFDRTLPAKTVAVGEIGLLGEIRDVSMQEKRVKEAVRLGYKNVISNKENKYLSNVVKIFKK